MLGCGRTWVYVYILRWTWGSHYGGVDCSWMRHDWRHNGKEHPGIYIEGQTVADLSWFIPPLRTMHLYPGETSSILNN